MTDSAFRALEEYSRNRSALNAKATIQFVGNEGSLTFPTTLKPGPSAASAERKFNFSITECEASRGALDLIKQPKQTAGHRLEAWGLMANKMQVQANDDVYETTKIRMAVAEETQKNKCTREIKPNQTDIGRKIKVKGMNNLLPSTTAATVAASSSVAAASRRIGSVDVAARPAVVGPDITRRTIQDRLVHLLAVRPYKKPELYVKLTGKGLTEQEKGQIGTILDSITYVRDSKYHLKRHIWNDVQEDWPFYTDQDRQSLKRRRPESVSQSPPSAGPPPKSSSLFEGGSGTSSSYKGDKNRDEPASKRQRISRVAKSSTETSHAKVKPPNNYSEDSRSGMSGRPSPSMVGTAAAAGMPSEGQSNRHSGDSNGSSNGGQNGGGRRCGNDSNQTQNQYDHKENSPMMTDTENSNEVEALTNELRAQADRVDKMEYDFSQFKTILSIDRRREYKMIFEQDYAEYRTLHKEIEKAAELFQQLDVKLQKEERLRSVGHGDQKVKQVKRQIMAEFAKNMRDPEHQRVKERFHYLHKKLSHITSLVREFDESRTGRSNVLLQPQTTC